MMSRRRPISKKGWVLGRCLKCKREHYVEPHGTTAACSCSPKEWTEHEPIPMIERDLSACWRLR